MEKIHYCTLFDSNYLDKGMVLGNSLNRVSDNHILYILAMDDKCYEILQKENIKNTVVIRLSDFLSQELEKIKNERSRAEFCWTCTSHLINYIFETFDAKICTYVDADLYFYSNPAVLIEEMGKCDAQIVEHRFTKRISDRVSRNKSGKYCVEFNTFKNNKGGRQLLSWWMQKCIESCSITSDSTVFGDQKYLEKWGNKSNVSVLKNLGGGVAPWNIGQYRFVKKVGDTIVMRKGSSKFSLVFYHFHNLNYLDKDHANINVYKRNWKTDARLVKTVYDPYLKEIDNTKDMLEKKYGFYPLLIEHPAKAQAHTKGIRGYIKDFSWMDFLKAYVLVEGKVKSRINASKDIININNVRSGR
ncbi:MAG: glycosyl transferase [Lachnospiraceae bacterium]|nr:glycosyl transferase [Lachnospiraceae bacterium]